MQMTALAVATAKCSACVLSRAGFHVYWGMHPQCCCAAAPGQAYDDSATLSAVFKLLEGFEGLLQRATVAADIQRRAAALLTDLTVELRRVRTHVPIIHIRSRG